MAAPIQTLQDALNACGVPQDGVLFNGATKTERIAHEIFDDEFQTCMDMSFDDFNSECKTLAGLNVNQGQIRLLPAVKRNIRGLIQWTKDKIITGGDPTMELFPVLEAPRYVLRYKTHQNFIDKSKTLSDIAKPEKLKADTKWSDWYPSFVNFLRAIPGARGVPLSYVIREEEQPALIEDPNISFLENYILMTELNGPTYETDKLEVHIYITSFVSGNPIAEAKIVAHGEVNCGRSDWFALANHFQGVGVHAFEITRAESVLNNLFYSGEKQPHMWWAEFEKELSRAFAIYQRVEGRAVHSNVMKLRILMHKVKADFLQQPKAALNVELARVPLTLTYENALATFRNAVNQKHPPTVGTTNNRTRRVNEVGGRFNNGRGGRGRGQYRGGYRGGRGRGRGNGRGRGGRHNGTRTRPDSWWAVSSSGQSIECHPKISYPNHIWRDIPEDDKRRIQQLRESARNQSSNSSVISEVTQNTTYINGQQYTLVPTNTTASTHQQIQQTHTQPSLPPAPASTAPSAPPTHLTIMGGRREQQELRSRNSRHGA